MKGHSNNTRHSRNAKETFLTFKTMISEVKCPSCERKNALTDTFRFDSFDDSYHEYI
jgi:hypothetical protein